MSTAEMTLLFQGVERAVSATTPSVLRLVLLPGETLRIPRTYASITALSGTAWITRGGKDILLTSGERCELRAARDCTVISAIGSEALLFEVR
jgi:hypothetical protein